MTGNTELDWERSVQKQHQKGTPYVNEKKESIILFPKRNLYAALVSCI